MLQIVGRVEVSSEGLTEEQSACKLTVLDGKLLPREAGCGLGFQNDSRGDDNGTSPHFLQHLSS